jgi:adenylosuccinate lyase
VPQNDETGLLLRRLEQLSLDRLDVDGIHDLERMTKHDVVAFLDWVRLVVEQPGRWLHYGLTSSDLVDTAQGMRFREMHEVVISELSNLLSELTRWCADDTPLIGRTHGQPAELLTMQARAWGWMNELANPASRLSQSTRRMAIAKLSGPVGTYAHNPPAIEVAVAKDLNIRPHGPGATQIASRAPLAAWASAAAQVVGACAKIAQDVRLMTLLGEVMVPMRDGQVGSSSMAHKQNPIQAEQVAGLYRMASGYAAMLQPVDVWLERDISHSSVERVAVPDLWHVTLHAIKQTTSVLAELVFDVHEIGEQITDTPEVDIARRTWQTLHSYPDLSIDQAREAAIRGKTLDYNTIYQDRIPEFAQRAMRNYPSAVL